MAEKKKDKKKEVSILQQMKEKITNKLLGIKKDPSSVLGGMSGDAAKKLKDRKKKIEDELKAAGA